MQISENSEKSSNGGSSSAGDERNSAHKYSNIRLGNRTTGACIGVIIPYGFRTWSFSIKSWIAICVIGIVNLFRNLELVASVPLSNRAITVEDLELYIVSRVIRGFGSGNDCIVWYYRRKFRICQHVSVVVCACWISVLQTPSSFSLMSEAACITRSGKITIYWDDIAAVTRSVVFLIGRDIWWIGNSSVVHPVYEIIEFVVPSV